MSKLRQQLLRRLRLLLAVWLLALAWAPVAAGDVALHAHVVQIATTHVAAKAAIAPAPVARRARSLPAAAPRFVARAGVTRAPHAACLAAHGPSFDGRALYLELGTLLR